MKINKIKSHKIVRHRLVINFQYQSIIVVMPGNLPLRSVLMIPSGMISPLFLSSGLVVIYLSYVLTQKCTNQFYTCRSLSVNHLQNLRPEVFKENQELEWL